MKTQFYVYPLVWLCLLLSLPGAQPPACAQSIRYVKPSATGDGSSWASASGDLQAMINAGGVQQVWVGAGTYKPTSGSDRSLSFSLKNGVAVYGGFVGNETTLSQKPGVNPLTGTPSSTTLSGDIGVAGNPSDNSYLVVNNSQGGLDRTAVLDGVVITGAMYGDDTALGGGMYNANNCSPSVSNCSFVDNHCDFGGGILNFVDSNPTLTNCSFVGNSAFRGGGIANYNNSRPSLINCSFVGNQADLGGGIFNYNSSASLTNCVVFGNGAGNTFYNESVSSVRASYCLLDASVTGYIDDGHNLTTTRSPFLSATDARLNPCSPSLAINAGNNGANTTPTDLAGNPRIYGGTIDLGAYEYQGSPASPVAITSQPPSASGVLAGANVSVPISLTGSVTQYQWYKDGSAVSGQSSATLNLTTVQPSDAGSYSLVVTGTCNSVTSTAFFLSVTPIFRYVRAGGTGDGSSWASASGDLQSQINAVGVQQVWVAAGTYQPAPGQYFALKEAVKVYGGFASSGNPVLADRNWSQYITTLKGNGTHVMRNEQNGLTNAALLDGFTLTGGQAGTGGGMLNNMAYPMINHCIFTDNRAVTWGGGICNFGPGTTTVVNSLFVNNSAQSGGAAFSYDRATPRFINVTLVANSASENGGAVHNYQGAETELLNAIVWGNHQSAASSQLYTLAPGQMRVSYSLLEGGGQAIIGGKVVDNIVSQDPLFGDAARGDYQLRGCSPAINAGNNGANTTPTDLTGNPRIYGGTIDLGTYEYQGSPTLFAITGQPASGSSVCVGSATTVSVSLSGEPASYQWYKDNTPLPTQTSAALSLSNLQPGDGGRYVAVIAGTCNSLTSTAFSLTVNSAPPASLQSDGSLSCSKPIVTLTAGAGDGFHYGFSAGATQLDGSNMATVSQAGSYSVVVTAPSGCTASASIVVGLGISPVVSIQATPSPVIEPGQSALLTATGASAYQWSTGATTASISVSATGTYSVTGTVGGCGVVASVAVVVSADGPSCGSYTTRTTANGLGHNRVYGVYAQGSTVYAATDEGLSISVDGGQTFTNYTTADGLGADFVLGVYAQGSTVYAATGEGLSISVDGGRTFTNRTTADGLGHNRVYGVYAQGSTVYAATRYGLSISVDGGQHFTNRTAASNDLGSSYVLGVYAQGSTVYAATRYGLSISVDGGQHFTNYTLADGNFVYGVYAQGNTVYAATEGGLSISVDGGQHFTNYTTANGLGSSDMFGVYALGSHVYAATSGGLSICSSEPTITGLVATPNPVCAGQPVSISANVGNTSGAYSFTLAGGTSAPLSGTASGSLFSQSVVASGAGPQAYTLTVSTDGGAASASLSVSVTPLPLASIMASTTLLSCATAVLSLTASSAGTYRWSTGQTSPVISVSVAGTYSLTVTNGSGCPAVASITLGQDQTPPTVSIAASTTLLSEATPSASLTATGAPTGPPFTFRWSTGQTTPLISVSVADTYSLTLTGANGCTATASVVISQAPLASFSCANGVAYQVAGSSTGNSTLYRYEVNTGRRTSIAPLSVKANAIGFDMENRLWGYDIINQRVIQIGPTGQINAYTVAHLPASGFNVGELLPGGYLVLYVTNAPRYYVVDVNPDHPTYLQLVDPTNYYARQTGPVYGTPLAGALTIYDFAYNPATGRLVALTNPSSASTGPRLVVINPATGAISDGPLVRGADILTETDGYGGQFIGATGSLCVFANQLGKFYRIDLVSGAATVLSSSTPASNNDGASCPTGVLSYGLSGSVVNDANGLSDNQLGGTGTNLGGRLLAILYDNTTGQVGAISPVTDSGTFLVGVTPTHAYTLYLTSQSATVGQSAVPTVSLPGSWTFVGEQWGSGPGSDGTPDGVLSLGVINSTMNSAIFGLQPLPDLSLILYARPSTSYGTTPISLVIDVVDVGDVASRGLITVLLTKDSRLGLEFDPTASSVNSRSVQNSAWRLDASSNADYYVLTTDRVIEAGETLSVGLRGTLGAGATSGVMTLSGVLVGGSGGEVKVTNNIDAEKIDYFQ